MIPTLLSYGRSSGIIIHSEHFICVGIDTLLPSPPVAVAILSNPYVKGLIGCHPLVI
jgi:hypothetical protein